MRTIKRIFYYLLSFTWGSITSIIGLLILIPFIFTKHINTFHGRLYGIFPKCFGHGWGFEMGCFWFTSYDCENDEHICCHEAGHGLQNIILGPLQLFISLFSVIRFWYRKLHYDNNKHIKPKTAYDDIWFEGWATKWGYKYVLTDKI